MFVFYFVKLISKSKKKINSFKYYVLLKTSQKLKHRCKREDLNNKHFYPRFRGVSESEFSSEGWDQTNWHFQLFYKFFQCCYRYNYFVGGLQGKYFSKFYECSEKFLSFINITNFLQLHNLSSHLNLVRSVLRFCITGQISKCYKCLFRIIYIWFIELQDQRQKKMSPIWLTLLKFFMKGSAYS